MATARLKQPASAAAEHGEKIIDPIHQFEIERIIDLGF